jgi:hypothetical protein
MRKFLLSFVTAYFTFLPSAHATSNGEYVEHRFTGQNFSGEYVCKGKNESVGDYEVFVTLKLNKISSNGKFGVYDFSTETLNNVTYYGQAVANGNRMALTFKLSDARNVEFSTGVGEFKKIGNRRWGFNNTYYEPDDSGGNYGTEYCAMKKPFLPPTKTVKKSKNTSVK